MLGVFIGRLNYLPGRMGVRGLSDVGWEVFTNDYSFGWIAAANLKRRFLLSAAILLTLAAPAAAVDCKDDLVSGVLNPNDYVVLYNNYCKERERQVQLFNRDVANLNKRVADTNLTSPSSKIVYTEVGPPLRTS